MYYSRCSVMMMIMPDHSPNQRRCKLEAPPCESEVYGGFEVADSGDMTCGFDVVGSVLSLLTVISERVMMVETPLFERV
jgi:hypothetical protein